MLGATYLKVTEGCPIVERLDNIEFNDEAFEEITEVTSECYRANSEIIICGDFNAHIGDDRHEYGIKNNPQPNPNLNGRNLITLQNKLNLSNIFEHLEISHGTGTYYSGNRVSILDYVLWSQGVNAIDFRLGKENREMNTIYYPTTPPL